MNPSRPTATRYLVMIWFCGLAALAYVQRNAVAVPALEIEEQLGISHEDMGFILGMFFWGYAAMQIPGGWLGGMFGTRIIVPILLLFSSLANALIGLALGMDFFLACRFFMGMAQAGLFPCAVQSIARWFPPSQRALPNGFLTAFMSVGGVVAAALSGFLLQFMDWQTLMFLYGAPGIGCAIWFALWFRDRPEDHPGVNSEELALIREGSLNPASPGEVDRQWYEPFLSLALLLVCVQQFFRAAAYVFYATWWPTFLRKARGLELEQAGYVSTFPLVGVAVGGIIGGQLSDWILKRTGSKAWSRKGIAIISLGAAGLFMILGYFALDVWLTVALLTLSSFFAGVCGTASYVVTIDLGGKHVATVFSAMNMSGNIGAALLPTVVIAVTNEHGWDSALLVLAALYLAAGVCWLGVRTTAAPGPTPVPTS